MEEPNESIDIEQAVEDIAAESDKMLIDVGIEENGGGKKGRKSKYEKACDYCSKIFKTEKSYDSHIKSQVCRRGDDLTYCKMCDLTLETNVAYKKHLVSIAHLLRIQTAYGVVETIEIDETPDINKMDPYLNGDDIEKLNKKTLGANFTLNYRDGRESTIVKLVKRKSDVVNPESVSAGGVGSGGVTGGGIDGCIIRGEMVSAPVQVMVKKIEPTERQRKILTYLEGVKEKYGEKLIELLKEKLQIEDYKNLQRFISESDKLSGDAKREYIEAINKFSMAMVKLKNRGEKLFKDKDIASIVMNLTA